MNLDIYADLKDVCGKVDLLTGAVSRLVVEAKVKNDHDNQLRALLERGVKALEKLATTVTYDEEINVWVSK